MITWPTRLDNIKNLHSTDSINTENSGTRGRSIWVHSSQVRLLDTSVPHSSMPEAVGLLRTGVTRDQVSRRRKELETSPVLRPSAGPGPSDAVASLALVDEPVCLPFGFQLCLVHLHGGGICPYSIR